MAELSERQKQIIEAAIELISEKSIQGLTIKNLAKKIELTEGAIYRHFDSKVDILLTILFSFQDEAKKMLNDFCVADISALQLIENLFQHHFEYFAKKPAVASVIFSESIFQNDNRLVVEVLKILDLHEQALACIIKKGKQTNEIKSTIAEKELVRIIIGSIRYTVTKWRLSGYDFDLRKEGKLMLESIKELLKP